MKTYFRILAYVRPVRHLIPLYLLFTLLAIVFGLVNFTLIMPLLDVLFDNVERAKLEQYESLPQAAMSMDYLVHTFYHYFLQVVDEYGKAGALYYVCGMVMVSVILSNLFRYLAAVLMAKLRVETVRSLQHDIFKRLSTLHLGFFTDERKGDMMSRMTNDVNEVRGSVVNTLKVLFADPAKIISYFIVLFTISLKLTLFTILLLPVTGIVIAGILKRLKRHSIELQDSLGRLLNILDEVLGGMRIVKAFNASQQVRDKFGAEVDHYARTEVHMSYRKELAPSMSEFLGVSVVTGLMLYGGLLVLDGNYFLTASAFITYLLIFSQVMSPAKSLSNAFSSIQRGLAAGERIFALLDTPPAIAEAPNAIALKGFEHEVRFEEVAFAYGDTPVLQEINLTLGKGKTIALVGPSGGGKSTLADLLPRFYDPTGGRITIDGHPLDQCSTESLRQQMGIVTQESILFNDTVFENISFGQAGATQEAVEQAAKIANAHEFIMALPQGYQTNIGERGTKLSGGQRQRLSIARAVLKNPPILILDEATSALDSESETLVQEALAKLMQQRTSLVIAHRLSTIQHADEIIVLERGRIVQRGTHAQLLEAGGLYKKLTHMQGL